jgi:RNA polymerase sigma factor (sigma-70 family)
MKPASDSDATERTSVVDDPLVVGAVSGDNLAFEVLLVEIALPIFRSIAASHRTFLRMLRPALGAEDFVQICAQSLIAVVRKAPCGGPLLRMRTRPAFAAYSRRLAARKVIEVDRRRRVAKREGLRPQTEFELTTLVLPNIAAHSPPENAQSREMAGRLRNALDQLSASDREIIILRFHLGFSFSEIANRYGRDARACQRKLTNITAHLKAILGEE